MIYKQVSKSVYIEQTHKTHTAVGLIAEREVGTGKFTAAFFFWYEAHFSVST